MVLFSTPMLHSEVLHRLCRARDWLRAEEDPQPSVNQIARRSGFAPHHFIRLFRAVFGQTPHRFRSVAQIERAKHLLILTDLSVTEICMAVGFSSLGSFSTLFTRHTGMAPSVWRRSYGAASGPLRELPPKLIPGCITLMAGLPPEKAISKKPGSGQPGTVAA